jgi:hypothetical protein
MVIFHSSAFHAHATTLQSGGQEMGEVQVVVAVPQSDKLQNTWDFFDKGNRSAPKAVSNRETNSFTFCKLLTQEGF